MAFSLDLCQDFWYYLEKKASSGKVKVRMRWWTVYVNKVVMAPNDDGSIRKVALKWAFKKT